MFACFEAKTAGGHQVPGLDFLLRDLCVCMSLDDSFGFGFLVGRVAKRPIWPIWKKIRVCLSVRGQGHFQHQDLLLY